MRRVSILFMALLVLAVPAAASAAWPKTTLPDVEDEVMCLECKEPLEVATDAPQAQRERALITALIAQCKSKSEIKAALVAQFGDRVLALPPGKGFDLTAYIVPALAVLAALTAIRLAAGGGRRRRPQRAGAPTGAPVSARLDADLEPYDL